MARRCRQIATITLNTSRSKPSCGTIQHELHINAPLEQVLLESFAWLLHACASAVVVAATPMILTTMRALLHGLPLRRELHARACSLVSRAMCEPLHECQLRRQRRRLPEHVCETLAWGWCLW